MVYFYAPFGLYEKLINSILNFFKDIKKNFTFLFPICLGVFVGVFLFGNIRKSYILISQNVAFNLRSVDKKDTLCVRETKPKPSTVEVIRKETATE